MQQSNDNANEPADDAWLIRQGFTPDSWSIDPGSKDEDLKNEAAAKWYTAAETLELSLRRASVSEPFSLYLGAQLMSKQATRGQVWTLLSAIRKVLQ